MSFQKRYLGHGVGLRPPHYSRVLTGPLDVDWFEVITENFLEPGGRPRAVLAQVRAQAPVVLHGVSLSIGGTDPLDRDYLHRVRALADWIEPAWVSDHLCWGSFSGRYAHDLLPLPYTEEALDNVVDRVGEVQDLLGRQILLENVSSYLSFRHSSLTEWEFLAEVARRADCGVLLDVNNIYVSARNHGFPAASYLDGVPVDRVGQIHLAGHTDRGTYLFDSHDGPVSEPVWALLRRAVDRFGPVSTLVEWDEHIPLYEELTAQARRAAAIHDEVLRDRTQPPRSPGPPLDADHGA